MFKRTVLGISSVFMFATVILGQNSNSSTSKRPRTAAAKPAAETQKTTTSPTTAPAEAQKPTDTEKAKTTTAAKGASAQKPRVASAQSTDSAAVLAAFNALADGIRHANVNAVTAAYWNSPRLVLFNNNGTVTKGWEQMHKNRESSYPDLKDVKLDLRDVSVVMLGRDGAVVSCLWTQSQSYKGTPETASGRMTLVFRRIGKDWKAVHLHTSPDKQDPTRVLPSEQASPGPSPSPSPTPNR